MEQFAEGESTREEIKNKLRQNVVIPYLVQIQLSFLSGNCSFHCHN